jgi:GNAT superfamily N-acetyltransferase
VPTVRAATLDDLEAVIPLWRELEAVQGPQRAYPVVARAEERIRAAFTAAIEADASDLLLAVEDGQAVGMALVRLERPSKMSDELAADLGRVVVRSDRRGTGVGRAIVDAAEAWARDRGVRTLVASIFIANEGSMRFWRAVGFEPWVERLVREVSRTGAEG